MAAGSQVAVPGIRNTMAMPIICNSTKGTTPR